MEIFAPSWGLPASLHSKLWSFLQILYCLSWISVLSFVMAWAQYCASHPPHTVQVPILPPMRCGMSSSLKSCFHISPFFTYGMPCSPCQAVSVLTVSALTGSWSQLSPVITVLCAFLPPSILGYVSPEIQYPHLPPCHLKGPILTHQRLFRTPSTIYPFLWSCLFTSDLNPLGCWIASLLISIWKTDGAKVRELCWTTWLGAIKYLFHLQTSASVLKTVAVLNKWQRSMCSLLLPLGFLTLLQIGLFWSLMLF